MRGDGGELLELGVGARQLGVGALERVAPALERVRHRVEAARELAELVLAVGRDTRRQIAGRQPPGRLGDGAHRPQERAAQVQREADRDRDQQAEAAGAGADRARRALLGAGFAAADDRALAFEQAPELRADRVEPVAAAVRLDLAAGLAEVIARDVDQHARPERVVVDDRLADLARAALLAGVVGDEPSESPRLRLDRPPARARRRRGRSPARSRHSGSGRSRSTAATSRAGRRGSAPAASETPSERRRAAP